MGPVVLATGQEVSVLGVAALGVGVGYFAGMFGIGGGFIMTPLLVVLFGVPLPTAVGSGLCQMVGTSLVTFLRQRKLGQGEVRFDALMLPGSLLGVELGARTLVGLSGAGELSVGGRSIPWISIVVEMLYAALLVWVAASHLRSAGSSRDKLDYLRPGPLSRVAVGPRLDLPAVGLAGVSAPLVAYVGLGLGFLSGLLGIGGGVALNPVLVYGYGFPIRHAVATGIGVIFATAVVGTVAHSLRGHVELGLAVPLLVGGTLSAQLGALSSRHLSGAALARILAVLLFTAVAALAWDLLSKFR
jgi:uncharacterized membrane protein YfcA